MKILFFGLGSIGKRYAKLIKDNYNHELYAFRHDKNQVGNELNIKEIYKIDQIDEIKPDIAFITNITASHLKYANICAEKGIDLFIEKPLSHDDVGLDDFKKIVKENNVNIYVAYCLRFHPVIK